MKVLSAALLVFLAVIGVVFILREVSLRLFRSRDERSVLIVTFPNSDPDSVEVTLRSAITRLRWGSSHSLLVCADCEKGSECERICQTLCDRYSVRMISKDDLIKTLYNSKSE